MRRYLVAACVAGLMATSATGVAQARQVSLATLMPVPSAGSTATSAAGTYVPLASPRRVVDTGTGAGGNRRGALHGGRSFAAVIAGRAGVPAAAATGSVLVSVSAWKATATGSLIVWGPGQQPRTANVQFVSGVPATNTAVVQLSRGRLRVASTATRGTVEVAVDVLGYFAGGSSSAPGAFHPLHPERVLDTGQKQALGPGRTITPTVVGSTGAGHDAGAVAVTITVRRPAATGALLAAAPGSPRPPGATVAFGSGRSTSAFAVLPLSGRRISLTNTSRGPVRVTVDVDGYFSPGIPETARTFRALDDARTADHALARHATITVDLAGRSGVPLRNVAAALVTVHAVDPAASGAVQVWRTGARAPSRAVALSFTASHSAATTLLVPLSAGGKFSLRNDSAGKTRMQIDIRGYVAANAVPVPGGTASARYLDQLIDGAGHLLTNEQTMEGFGCADAGQGVQFELLDVGAQSVTGPQLSKTKPGVALALTEPNTVRLDYADLSDAIEHYLMGYTEPK